MRGGAGGAHGKKIRKSSARPKKTASRKATTSKKGNWVSTGRQITTKRGARKTVYVNSATAEQRVRDMVVDKNTGAKRAHYVKF